MAYGENILAKSGIFARDERRAAPPPRLLARPVATDVEGHTSKRLSVGLFAMAAFVAAGFVRLYVGLPVAVYLIIVTTALVVLAVALFAAESHSSRTPSRRLTRDRAATKFAPSLNLNSKVATEVMQ